MFRNWFLTGAGVGGANVRIQYPKYWIHYFGQPVFYLSSRTGKFLHHFVNPYKPYLLINAYLQMLLF